MRFRNTSIFLLMVTAFLASAGAQQSPTDPPPSSLAHYARGGKSATATTPGAAAEQPAADSSLADRARQLQGHDLAKVKVSPEQAREILKSIQPLLEFASDDSGLPIKSAVKPRMISRDDLHITMQARKVDDREARRLQATELTLKKFGYVPRVFSTGKFVESMYEEQVAGFYDPRTKMITLLNWVAPEAQLDIVAHELTHALQDQNFNLLTWERTASRQPSPARFQVGADEALAESEARRAVIEGQAMVVLVDHQFQQRGLAVTLESVADGASSAFAEYLRMIPVPDTPVIHSSPIFLREALTFPYREGLLFELELLAKGHKELAFNKVFAHPPINTHEILHPQAYIHGERIRAPHIPDLGLLLADQYEVADSGGLGELDVRSLIKQYGNSAQATTISKGWRGSSYLMVKRKQVEMASATPADAALVYVSAWDSTETAHQFARFYADALPKRYAQAEALPANCKGPECPLESFHFTTEEGFVSIECRPNNLVVVTESFEPAVAESINTSILKTNSGRQTATAAMPDLSLRYLGSPVFAGLREMWEEQMLLEMLQQQK
jgi:hypothetical protein